MDNFLIPILGVIAILLAIIVVLVRKLKANDNAIQYSVDNTLPDMDTVIEKAPAPVQQQVDAVKEIQQYIDAGRLPQAVGLLNKAIASEPSRSDLRLMLLGIYAQQNDSEQFEQAVDGLHALNDPHAIARANELRTTMSTSAEELPVESMIAAAASPEPVVPELVDDGMIEFDSPEEVTLEDATSEVAAIDFDFDETPEDQLAQLETEVTSTHLKTITEADLQPTVDKTEEITFDFSDNTAAAPAQSVQADDDLPELSLDIPVDSSEDLSPTLEFDAISDAALAPESELSPVLIDTDEAAVNNDFDDFPALEMPTQDEVAHTLNLPVVDAPVQQDAAPAVVPDAVAVTNEFEFDLDSKSDIELGFDSQIDEALSAGSVTPDVELVQSVNETVNETGTFDFDSADLSTDVVEPDAVVQHEAESLSVIEEAPASLELETHEPNLAETSDFEFSDALEVETPTPEATSLEMVADQQDLKQSTDESSARLTPLNDVVPESMSPDDTIAQLDAIFLNDIGQSSPQEPAPASVNPAAVASGVAAAGAALASSVNAVEEKPKVENSLSLELDSLDKSASADSFNDTIDLDAINDSSVTLSALSESDLGISEVETAQEDLSAVVDVEPVPLEPTVEPVVTAPAVETLESGDLLNQLKAEFSFVDANDANQTNLELASRYIELGEHGSAKSLLEEVVSAGSIEQQGEAKQLLEKVNV